MSEINASPVPAGWYVDPSGLPQQRWWDGRQWTHDVTPMKQDLSQLPAPQFGTYSQPQAIPVRREPEHTLALALPATTTQPDAFPTRRQRRREFEEAEAARLAAEAAAAPHPSAPFAMPSADVADAPVAATPAPAEQLIPVATVTAPAAPLFAEPVVAESAPQPIAEPLPAAAVAFAAAVTAPVTAAPAVDVQPAPPVAAQPAPVEIQPAPPVAAQPALQFSPQVIPMPQPTPSAAWPFQSSSMQASMAATPPAAAIDPANSVPYQPFGMIPKTTAGAVVAPDKSETVSAWLIAVMPLIMVGVAVLIVTQLGDYYTRFMQGGLVFIFALLTIALAVRDNRELRAAGHLAPASPAWVLLTPLAYLSVRSSRVRKETGHGSAPLWVWLIVVAAVVAGCLLLPEWLDKIITVSSIF